MKKYLAIALLLCMAATAFMQKNMNQTRGVILNHIALSVVKLSVSTRFYQDIIRLDSIPEPFKDGKHSWFRIGEHSQLHVIEAATAMITHDKNTHLCFSVPSMEDFIQRLEKNNIPFTNWKGDSKTPTVRPDGVKQIYLQDPDGYWIEINNDKY